MEDINICGFMKLTLLDYPEHMACTVFTGGCNFRCPFCHNSELLGKDTQPIMSTEELYEYLDKRAKQLEGIVFTGGEPTLHYMLPQIMKHIKDNYGLKIKLDTNGTNYQMLSRLIRDGLVDYVAMDIKAGGYSNYMKAAGVWIDKQVWRNIVNSKDLLIESNEFSSEFRTTVVGGLHTKKDFEEIKDFIKGAKRYYLQSYVESEQVLCKDKGFYSPSKKALEEYAEIIKDSEGQVSIRGVD